VWMHDASRDLVSRVRVGYRRGRGESGWHWLATMTTIPARLAKAAQVSHSLAHAQSRARSLYRSFYRSVSVHRGG